MKPATQVLDVVAVLLSISGLIASLATSQTSTGTASLWCSIRLGDFCLCSLLLASKGAFFLTLFLVLYGVSHPPGLETNCFFFWVTIFQPVFDAGIPGSLETLFLEFSLEMKSCLVFEDVKRRSWELFKINGDTQVIVYSKEWGFASSMLLSVLLA